MDRMIIQSIDSKHLKILFAVFLATVLLFSTAGLAVTAFGSDDDEDDELDDLLEEATDALEKYEDVQIAIREGYVSTIECVEVPGLGGMGIHFVNFGLLFDYSLNALTPEVLLYIPDDDGELELVAVEYVMLATAPPWFDPGPPPPATIVPAPSIFGQTLNGPMPGHELGDPWHYELHVWLFEENPNGPFADFNPEVSCSDDDSS